MRTAFFPLLLLPLPFLLLSDCLTAPNSYRLVIPKTEGLSCGAVRIPDGWTFESEPDDSPSREGVRREFATRWENGESSTFLLAGSETRGTTIGYSNESFRVRLKPAVSVEPVSKHVWERATPAQLVRRHIPIGPGPVHEVIQPFLNLGARSFPLAGTVFWNAPEVTRVSANNRYTLAISYSHRHGAIRPKSSAHFEVFHSRDGRRVFAAKGEAPNLPPFAQFSSVAWLGDSVLLMPHNNAGTDLDACYFDPPETSSD